MYEVLGKLLKRKGVTVYRLCKDTGIAQATIIDWRNGKSTPKLDKLIKIAEYFGVSVDYLLGNTDIQSPDRSSLTDEDVRFALFGGEAEYISDEAFDDVKRFAQIVAEKERRKRNGDPE